MSLFFQIRSAQQFIAISSHLSPLSEGRKQALLQASKGKRSAQTHLNNRRCHVEWPAETNIDPSLLKKTAQGTCIQSIIMQNQSRMIEMLCMTYGPRLLFWMTRQSHWEITQQAELLQTQQHQYKTKTIWPRDWIKDTWSLVWSTQMICRCVQLF